MGRAGITWIVSASRILYKKNFVLKRVFIRLFGRQMKIRSAHVPFCGPLLLLENNQHFIRQDSGFMWFYGFWLVNCFQRSSIRDFNLSSGSQGRPGSVSHLEFFLVEINQVRLLQKSLSCTGNRLYFLNRRIIKGQRTHSEWFEIGVFICSYITCNGSQEMYK